MFSPFNITLLGFTLTMYIVLRTLVRIALAAFLGLLLIGILQNPHLLFQQSKALTKAVFGLQASWDKYPPLFVTYPTNTETLLSGVYTQSHGLKPVVSNLI